MKKTNSKTMRTGLGSLMRKSGNVKTTKLPKGGCPRGSKAKY